MTKPVSNPNLCKAWALAWRRSQECFVILPLADLLRQNLREHFCVGTEESDWRLLGLGEREADLQVLQARLEAAMDEPLSGGDLLAKFSASPMRREAKTAELLVR